MARTNQQTAQMVVLGLAAAASISLLLWHLSKTKKQEQLVDKKNKGLQHQSTPSKTKPKPVDTDPTPRRTNTSANSPANAAAAAAAAAADSETASVGGSAAATSSVKSSGGGSVATATADDDNKAIHSKIEELDKKGKALFKNKQFLEAAQAFTDALEYIANNCDTTGSSATASSMLRQQITLINNRSAMYEKAGVHELALDDCDRILEMEMTHTKARTRKLRILEILKRYPEALQEVCATQLLFMQANRVNLRMGLPVPPPPVPQSKMEEILNEILPGETETYVALLNERNKNSRQLPGHYTILQLLRSYTEYNSWMALAAKDGSVTKLSKELESAATLADKALLLFKRGRRHVYDRKYEEATQDLEQAYALVDGNDDAIAAMKDDSYARLLEWTGMVRHWHYDLDSAMACLEKAAEVEPENALLVVKQAGVQLDAGKQEEALKLFERALAIDPEATDALLHRSNLRIMQGKPELAKSDLETCIRLRPSYTMARLRLAAILVPMENIDGAKKQLDLAEQSEPNSSEIHSYRGELFFAQGEMDEARLQFEKAIKLEPNNPTPYVNAAMALINTPPETPGQMPDTTKVMRLLEQAIEVDPQFAAAYVHLGQLKLGTATELSVAREVVKLYDQGLENCRSPEEVKELCGMRVLAMAQVEAASMLKMETFNMQ